MDEDSSTTVELPVVTQAPTFMEEAIERRAKLFAALAKAQGAFPEIAKNRAVEITMKSGGKFRFRYADLQAIIAATKGPLSSNGLSVIQLVNQDEANKLTITTILAHEGGGTLRSTVAPKLPDDADPKSIGAVITYYRRYQYQALLCISSDDDLDEADDQIHADTPAFIAEMTAVAQQGVAAYAHYWTQTLTAAQRVERKALHEGMKKVAAKADADKAVAAANNPQTQEEGA